MPHAIPFGARSTADEVLAGVDLTRKRVLVTECDSDLAVATMSAMAANGAQVVGLAKTLEGARAACRTASLASIPMACDTAEPASVAAAAQALHGLPGQWDAIIASAPNAAQTNQLTHEGVAHELFSAHMARFFLVNELVERVRDATGRIVIVCGEGDLAGAPDEDVLFDSPNRPELDRRRVEEQMSLGAVLYAKELSRRLAGRRIAVNSLRAARCGRLPRGVGRLLGLPIRWGIAGLFAKSGAQAAATPALLAASPRVAGKTGEYWSACKVLAGSPWVADRGLATRLWEVSENIARRYHPIGSEPGAARADSEMPRAQVTYLAGRERDRMARRA